MGRDEGRFIEGWLRWHYRIGFRRFVIIDHLSSDDMAGVAREFARELADVQLAVVSEFDEDYRQREMTTGAARYAVARWPDTDWVFALDLDEHLSLQRPLTEVLESASGSDVLRLLSIDQHSRRALELARGNQDPRSHGHAWIDAFGSCRATAVYKVAISAEALSTLAFSQGNHLPEGEASYRCASGVAGGVILRHVPNRDYPSFLEKVRNMVHAGYADPDRYRIGGAGRWVPWATALVNEGEDAVRHIWIDNQVRHLAWTLREPRAVLQDAAEAFRVDS